MREQATTQMAIAAAYALAGWLSLQIALPTGYVAPVYPPAGIALAALILFGYRMWPGVLVGALFTNYVATGYSGAEPGIALIVSGVAATLQALAGAWLAHRVVGLPNPLDSPRSIIRLLFVVAPASCLINATLSVPFLAMTGTLASTDILFSWWAWWLGDTLGALIALPVMFVFFARPTEVWRPRRITVTVPLLVVSLLTAAVFVRLQDAESMRIDTQFQRESENVATLVEKRLFAHLDALIALERFSALNHDFSREDFREFTTPLLERHPGTQNFSWNPHVTQDFRSPFEDSVSRIDLPGYRILDRDDGSPRRTRAAEVRDEYLPILFVEPLLTNTGVVGLDPTSIPSPAEAIAKARTTGAPAATEGFTLTQEAGAQRGVVVYQAVLAYPPWEDGTRPFKGLVSGAFRMDDTLSAALNDLLDRRLVLCLVDRSAASGNARLSGPEGCDRDQWMNATHARGFAIEFAQRQWEIRLVAEGAYEDGLRTLTAWSSIVTGVLAAGVLGAFLLMTSGHARRIERLVDQRTGELAAVSDILREQRSALTRAQKIAHMGSWELDTASGEVHCSDGLRDLLRLPGNVLGYPDLLNAIATADRPRLDRSVSALMNGGETTTIDCHPQDDPGVTLQFVIDSENLGTPSERIVGTAQDVSSARKAEADIQQLAHFDSLTGLPNRMLWSIRAHAALQGAKRHGDVLAVLFLDLDHFKTVNDSLGHRAGDVLLQIVARRLSQCMREEDFLARLGGDEFVALLPRLADSSHASTVAHKMLSSMTESIEVDGHSLQPAVSIGIALFPADGGDVDTLLKHADTAMYGAKSAGRNTFRHFVGAMNVQALERLKIENGLRRAIERNELVLHYQPQYDAVLERIVGVEALVRWNSPELGGLIPPDRFIGIAEDSGIILALGEWVLHKACTQQRLWQDKGLGELLVAVNISALQFNRQNFVERVFETLTETGADNRRIEFEITETALMGPSTELVERLSRLRALGITLSLDDFGTGYSSLSQLTRLPISRLKLDRAFVRNLPGDPDNAAIANATLSMARALKLDVVAEGIETESQRAYLFARGCRLMQGFLISKPLPLEELEAFLEATQPQA